MIAVVLVGLLAQVRPGAPRDLVWKYNEGIPDLS